MSEQGSSAISTSHGVVVRAALRTDVGLVRAENQDCATFTTADEEARAAAQRGRLLMVADGMGGHRGGATASRMACEIVKEQYVASDSPDVSTALRDAVIEANRRIFVEAESNPDLGGMGTTISAIVVRGAEAWLAHVGDSRIYLVREASIRQLTEDHSLVATMVREGLLTAEEAEVHPRRNVLQRSLGVGEDVDVDVAGPIEVREGDTLILCSDGLHGLVKDAELLEIAQRTIEAAADEFIRRALDRGAPDNVTVIVARAESADRALAPATDATMEETQPVPHAAPGADDLSVRDAAPVAPENNTDAVDARVPASRSVLGWAIVAAVAVAAAGAWVYWNYEPSFVAAPTSLSR